MAAVLSCVTQGSRHLTQALGGIKRFLFCAGRWLRCIVCSAWRFASFVSWLACVVGYSRGSRGLPLLQCAASLIRARRGLAHWRRPQPVGAVARLLSRRYGACRRQRVFVPSNYLFNATVTRRADNQRRSAAR